MTREDEATSGGGQVRVTPLDVERFTEGDCHYLARALARETGWPLMAFAYGRPAEPTLHAFVLMPDLRALDVEGPLGLTAFKRKWGESRIAEFDWESLRRKFCSPSFGDYTYSRAKIVAARLLAHPEVAAVADGARARGAGAS